jgi:hypothetical protein
MSKQNYFYIFVLCVSALWMGCANEMNPTGGPKDEAPPKLLARTLKDSSLNFKGGKVEFDFDEKIEATNIVVETFPIMKTKPKVDVIKKKLSILLPDSLLEQNTTYKISLGNSVKDIYEGNAYQNLSFTFSTGNVLDSLLLKGSITKAINGDADTSAWIMLYPKIESDSDISKILPLYATKADDRGEFIITNLPNKEFFIYAFSDANKNLKYDYPLESIGFLPTTVLPVSSKMSAIKMRTFYELPDTNADKAFQKRMFSNTFKGCNVNIDTADKIKRTYDITQPISINIANSFVRIDKSKIRLYSDSLLDETGIMVVDSAQHKIKLNVDFLQDANYKLVLLDSFAVDSSGPIKGNTYLFRTKKESDYGTLIIKFKNENTDEQRYIQLYNADKLIATQMIKDSTMEFKLLLPGNYTLRMLHDANKNGKWDSGKYYGGKLQAELIEKYREQIVVKANWQNSIEWSALTKK